MGQKVHPIGIRLGIVKEHNSLWYANPKHYADYLVTDLQVRDYLNDKQPDYLLKQLQNWQELEQERPAMDRFKSLLTHLQHWPYQIDQEQFGREKPLTLSESVFFPYTDCEDRVYALAALNIQYQRHGFKFADAVEPPKPRRRNLWWFPSWSASARYRIFSDRLRYDRRFGGSSRR